MAFITLPPALRGPGAAELLERPSGAGAPATGGASFGEALGQALASVDKLQLEADQQAEAVAMGGGNLHETALALEKADVGLRVATKVRNKLVEAYQEVMRMSV